MSIITNSSINKVFLIGCIETSPRRHNNALGDGHLCFSLVTNETIRSGKEPIEHIELHHLVIASDHPDVRGRKLYKGDQVCIMGKAQTKAWRDAENVRRYKTEVWVSQLEML